MLRLGMRLGSIFLVGLGGWLLLGSPANSAGGTGGKPLVPAAEFTALLKQDAKVIEDILSKGAPDKKAARKVKIAAFMLAAYAQANTTKDNAAQMAGIQEAALKLLKQLEMEKFQESLTLVKTIPTIKDGPKTGKPMDLHKAFDFSEMMHQFSSERVGGFGIEKELGDLAEGKLTPAQVDYLGTLGYKLAVIGHMSLEFTEDKNEGGKKTPKNWAAQAEHFRKAALEMATVARSKNAAGTLAALEKVNASCVKCHDDFR